MISLLNINSILAVL